MTKGKSDGKTKRITRDLPVPMSKDRLSGAKDELAALVSEEQAIETELQAITAPKRKRVREIRKDLRRLSTAIATKKELAPVGCEERRIFSQNKVEVYRLDTNELVETRPLKGEERQEEIDVASGKRVELDGAPS